MFASDESEPLNWVLYIIHSFISICTVIRRAPVRPRACLHLADKFLLSLRAKISVNGGLDLEEVLDNIFETF